MIHSTGIRSVIRNRQLCFSLQQVASYRVNIDPMALNITPCKTLKEKTPKENLLFGHTLTDHMLEVDWDHEKGWYPPRIMPYSEFKISPAATALHYGIECFEGMKAYKDARGKIRLFRPDQNIKRLNYSMSRLAMPEILEDQNDKSIVKFRNGFLECIKQLLKVDESWIPSGDSVPGGPANASDGYSMYIRPTAIGTSPFLGVHVSEQIKLYALLSPVGPYYKSGFKPIKLLADTTNARAWPGGVGNVKVGGNYGATIRPSTEAATKHGCNQILWLYGPDHQITEVGAMNIFLAIVKKDGKTVELVTAPLSRGDILPGVTRSSILEVARSWMDADHPSAKPSKDVLAPFTQHHCPSTYTAEEFAFLRREHRRYAPMALKKEENDLDDVPLTTRSDLFKKYEHFEVNERWITMAEVVEASKEGRLLEAFGAGTAVVVNPVKTILYKGEEIHFPTGEQAGPIANIMWNVLADIQYGRIEGHPWSIVVE